MSPKSWEASLKTLVQQNFTSLPVDELGHD